MTMYTGTEREWSDWRWQERNSLRSSAKIREVFPQFPEEERQQVAEYERTRRWGITPYTLSLMEKDELGNPHPKDPLVMQTFPVRGFRLDGARDSYGAGKPVNWELPEEMPTPILQHKYTNKVILRMPSACLAYCGYCFEVERTEDKESGRESSVTSQVWQDSLRYVREHPEVMEVIFSGGDLLLLENSTLEERIADVRAILNVRAVRVHTRALTFNPFRIDDKLVDVLRVHRVTELGLHFSHPNELTADVKEALERFNERGYGSILKMAQIPLLKGINDDVAVLEELFMKLYAEFQIKPYYLYHGLPWSPAASQFRTSVRRGVQLMNRMKHRIPSVALPVFAIAHHKGKHIVPLEEEGTPEFKYEKDEAENPIIRFKNWKGDWEVYLDRE